MMSKYFCTMTSLMSMALMLKMWNNYPKETTLMMEWNLSKIYMTNFKIIMTTDLKSTTFSMIVLTITTSILIYSNFYMKESAKKNSFMKLVIAFITSMMLFIFSPNMISMLMGWEGLGMTSFLLIMFYQNKSSMKSSFYTMMMNRMGDIMLIISMANMMNLASWTMTSMMFNHQNLIISMMMVAAFSKSAQMPFSSWLTEAMAAPTPISALVHSSTLVTAGVFLIIRFEETLKYSKMSTSMLLVSMTTMTMASMNSLTEWDMKKMVALSTLTQLSMMFITISMNLYNLALFHLMVHASFKALIFLCSSSFISEANTQDIRKMNTSPKNMFITKLSFNLAILTLSGFPFMSSFYSKEMMMEMMINKKMSIMITVTYYMCMMTTLIYSLKLIYFINAPSIKNPMLKMNETNKQKISKVILMVPSMTFGNKMNWIININFKIPHMTKMEKMMPTMMMAAAITITSEIYKSQSNKKMKNTEIKMTANYMWFMKNMSIKMKKTLMMQFKEMLKNTEKTTFTKTIESTKNMVKNKTKMNFKITHKTYKNMSIMMLMTAMMML